MAGTPDSWEESSGLNADAAEWKPSVKAFEFVPGASSFGAAPAPAPAPAAAPVQQAPASRVLDLSAPAAQPDPAPQAMEVDEQPAPAAKPQPAAKPAAAVEAVTTGVQKMSVKEKKNKEKVAIVERERKHLNIIFIGHVDAGKSTISGHVLYATGHVDDRTLDKYAKEAKEKNRESWKYAWALDTTTEERAKGKTEECGRGSFETESRGFTIIDAPGHKNFVPHMIGGASQADIAVMVISARRGEFETGFEKGGQTREHAILAKTAGVRALVVVINKMDDITVEWSKERYDECVTKLTPFLKGVGFNPKNEDDCVFLPISGLGGYNIKTRVDPAMCPWYNGKSLLEILDTIKLPKRFLNLPLRLPIQDKFKDMGTFVMGKVEAGVIQKGMTVGIMPNKKKVEVAQITMEGEEMDFAEPGDNVNIKLKNIEDDELRSGFVICSMSDPIKPARVFDVKLTLIEYKSIICAGFRSVMHIHAAVEEVVITNILAVVDKKGEIVQKNPKFAKVGQTILARLRADKPVCLEAFKDFQQLGRFTLRDEGKTVGLGLVTEVHRKQKSEAGQSK